MAGKLICDSVFEEHETGARHPESPDRLRVIREGYDDHENPSWERTNPSRSATKDELLYYHTDDYIERVRECSDASRSLDADTPTSERSFEIATLAAGSSLDLAETGLDENLSGFGAIRPPGHHAESNRGMGFCLFNNIVLAAEEVARRDNSVAIVDIDVHHGNGTQDAFYDRDDVLYVSTHQAPFYPGTGQEHQTGEGNGEGFTVNVTLPAGSDWNVLEPDWYGKIKKTIHSFKPDYIMVSAGFDAHETDPVGGLNFKDEDYLQMAKDLSRWAEELCEGRILGLLEGGYNLETLRRLVPRFTEVLID
jgi:acetoin utilization deacetylase AcuC-like enzyme